MGDYKQINFEQYSERIIYFLKNNTTNNCCVFCGCRDFAIVGFSPIYIEKVIGSFVRLDKNNCMCLYATVCNKCGHVNFFSLGPTKILGEHEMDQVIVCDPDKKGDSNGQ
jgi:hypothetical protein